jgi:hypothetical protein
VLDVQFFNVKILLTFVILEVLLALDSEVVEKVKLKHKVDPLGEIGVHPALVLSLELLE